MPGFDDVTTRWDMRSNDWLMEPVQFYLRLPEALNRIGVCTPELVVGVIVLAAKFWSEGTTSE